VNMLLVKFRGSESGAALILRVSMQILSREI
jgi:hypothetical protein